MLQPTPRSSINRRASRSTHLLATPQPWLHSRMPLQPPDLLGRLLLDAAATLHTKPRSHNFHTTTRRSSPERPRAAARRLNSPSLRESRSIELLTTSITADAAHTPRPRSLAPSQLQLSLKSPSVLEHTCTCTNMHSLHLLLSTIQLAFH
ncbi:hypothetical protein KC19_VG103800 [Ceratodon purpureus]|uniref:Uncharacterized protein n=1 Tax=Ceratodon purpureus TaxID=3225 RepID=A0A8T0HP22_CERPU|nr:hypothetical protein KC19_VG103800 [Ceratodon purpureus]